MSAKRDWLRRLQRNMPWICCPKSIMRKQLRKKGSGKTLRAWFSAQRAGRRLARRRCLCVSFLLPEGCRKNGGVNYDAV